MMLAGYGRRLGQMFSDNLIVLIPAAIVVAIFDQIGNSFLGGLAGYVVTAGYLFKCFTTKGGQSLGNRVAATRVRDASSGAMLGTNQAMIRTLIVMCYFFSDFYSLPIAAQLPVLVVGVVDNAFPLFDKRKQTLHDKLAHTIVVIA
jgi:uncharacterized RDD family membrane protein YckC